MAPSGKTKSKKKVKNPAATVARLTVHSGVPVTVVIDPGHGDIISKGKTVDPGCMAAVGGVTYMEKDIALQISMGIRDKLKDQQMVKEVFLTREADNRDKVTRFKWRTDVAAEKNAQIFVSVHVNSGGRKATGHVVYYYPGPIALESGELAKKIDASLSTIAAFSSGGYKSETKRMGLVRFGGTSPVEAAVLVEAGFITNDDDRTTLSMKGQTIGEEIGSGILDYIAAAGRAQQ